MEIAEESKAARAERAHPHLALFAWGDHFFDRRIAHFELVGRIILVGDDDEERLAGRDVNFDRRKAMVFQRERISCEIFGARRREKRRRTPLSKRPRKLQQPSSSPYLAKRRENSGRRLHLGGHGVGGSRASRRAGPAVRCGERMSGRPRFALTIIRYCVALANILVSSST
jgi:hypothetical protein